MKLSELTKWLKWLLFRWSWV